MPSCRVYWNVKSEFQTGSQTLVALPPVDGTGPVPVAPAETLDVVVAAALTICGSSLITDDECSTMHPENR